MHFYYNWAVGQIINDNWDLLDWVYYDTRGEMKQEVDDDSLPVIKKLVSYLSSNIDLWNRQEIGNYFSYDAGYLLAVKYFVNVFIKSIAKDNLNKTNYDGS